MVKYESTYTKGTLSKKKKRIERDLSHYVNAIFLHVFFLIFSIKPYVMGSPCNSNGYPQHLPL